MTNEKIMREAPVWKLLLKMSLPMVVIMLMNVLYNMADVFFLGQTGNSLQVAAASLSGPVFSALSGLGLLLGSGACTAISIALGQGDKEQMKRYSSFAFWSGLALGIGAGAAILLGIGPLVSLLGANAETAGFMTSYLQVMALGAPLMMVSGVLGNMVRADGASIAPMAVGLVGNLVNVALDPLFILTFGWGVAGAALATVAGNLVTALGCFWLILRNRSFSLSPRHFTLRRTVSLRVLGLGLPMASGVILQSFSGVFGNNLVVKYGNTAVAARSVAGTVSMLLFMVIMAICMGVQPAISYAYGAGNRKRMNSILRTTGAATVALGTLMAAGTFLCRDALIAFFLTDPQVMELGRSMVLGSLVSVPVYAIYQLCCTYLQATGKVGYATFISLLRQGLVMIPVLYLMELILGLMGIVYSGAVADLISTVIAGALSLRWARQIAGRFGSSKEILPASDDLDPAA